MSILEDSKILLKSYDLQQLDNFGLGRWDEEYYLAGLYHPLRYMKQSDVKKPNLSDILGVYPESQLDVYIHVPFCHVNCTFCHFYKEIISRNENNDLEDIYINSVFEEIRSYQKLYPDKLTPISIQFGGGTPSALSIRGLERFIEGLKELFNLQELSEVKFEFHPDMANDISGYRNRLKILREFGLTTAIIDLEATNEKVLKAISRGNTSRDGFLNLIQIAIEEGIPSVASAYMTGLPCETVDTFTETLNFLSSISNIDAINLYPLMFKPSDAVFRQRRKNPNLFVSPSEKDLMMVLATQILQKAGFQEGPCHFFRRESHLTRQQLSKAESKTLLGLGPASFGYLNGQDFGLQYMNYPDLSRYVDAVNSGYTGIWRSSKLSSVQKQIRSLLFALNSFRPIPILDMLSHISSIEADRINSVLHSLHSLNLVSVKNDTVQITEKGKLRNAEIIFYLSEPNVIKWQYDDPEYELIRRYEFFPDISKDNQLLFEKYLARMNPVSRAA